MIPVTHLLVVLSLCTALPSFGMEPDDDARLLHRFKDDQDWTWAEDVQCVDPFKDMVVACRTKSLDDEDMYKMDESNPTCYVLLKNYAGESCYDCMPYCLKKDILWYLSDGELRRTMWFMRLLTCDEARCLIEAKKSKKIHLFRPDAVAAFTLGNLIPQERSKYFHEQAHKNRWQWQRLLLLGHKDPGSPLHLLPKDIIRSLTHYTLNAQVRQLEERATLEDTLDF